MPAPLSEPILNPDLYDRDCFEWTLAQAKILRRLRPGNLDWENVAEEIESLGRADKAEHETNLHVVLLHLLKWRYQPEARKSGWKSSFKYRHRISKLTHESPSLRPFPGEVVSGEYWWARGRAADQTGLPLSAFPEIRPFTIEDVLDRDFLPA